MCHPGPERLCGVRDPAVCGTLAREDVAGTLSRNYATLIRGAEKEQPLERDSAWLIPIRIQRNTNDAIRLHGMAQG